MGQKGKPQHVRFPKGGSKVSRDAALTHPKGGKFKDKRDKRQGNPNRQHDNDW
jgi:hypothetical protein